MAHISDALASSANPLWLWLLLCRGTDLELPFACPLDYLLPVDQFDLAPNLPYRLPGFFDSPQVTLLTGSRVCVFKIKGYVTRLHTCGFVNLSLTCLGLACLQVPASVKNSRAALQIASSIPQGEIPEASRFVGDSAQLWSSIPEDLLLKAARPVEHYAVLTLRWAAHVYSVQTWCTAMIFAGRHHNRRLLISACAQPQPQNANHKMHGCYAEDMSQDFLEALPLQLRMQSLTRSLLRE